MKKCSSCQETKPLDQFGQYNSRSGVRKTRAKCLKCLREESRAKRLENPNSPERLLGMRKNAFRRKYGLSWDQYQQMFTDREGKCDICSLPETRQIRGKLMPLCVDHEDTQDGVFIRGLLCSNCNVAIGLLKHDRVLVKSAYRYLKKE